MDSIRFLSNRHLNMDSIFTSDEEGEDSMDYNAILSALSNTLEKQVRTWWDIVTFEHYLKENIIMHSIRWEVSPQDGLDDAESSSEWLDFFNWLGFKLQQLVLRRKKRKMISLEKKISELQEKLDPIKGTTLVKQI